MSAPKLKRGATFDCDMEEGDTQRGRVVSLRPFVVEAVGGMMKEWIFPRSDFDACVAAGTVRIVEVKP